MAKYKVRYHNKFKKDYKKILSRGYDISQLEKVIGLLADGKKLPEKYRVHHLTGNYKDYRECHVNPDWLLVYKIKQNELVLALARTGTHSDVF